MLTADGKGIKYARLGSPSGGGGGGGGGNDGGNEGSGGDERSGGGVGDDEPTPLPMKPLIVLCLMQSCDAIAFFQIFPYVAFLILDFGVVDDVDQVGQYAGYIGSSYALATVFSAYIWGMAADRYGRRPILLSGLFGTIICTVCFGMSTSLRWAIASRCLWGLSNGNLGVVKTYIAEITDDSNKAKAFTLLGMSGGLGRIAGNTLGGLLARPTFKVFGSTIFQTYPYLLPNLLSALVSSVGAVLGVMWLDETLHRKPQSKSNIAAQTAKPRRCVDPTVLTCAMLYGGIALLQSTYMESFPVWAVNAPDHGGIGFSQMDIGVVNAVTGAFQIVFSTFMYAPLANFLGPLLLYRSAMLGMIPLYCALSLLPLVAGSKTVLWSTLLVPYLVLQGMTVSCYTSVFQLIAKSTTSERLGAANGVGQTFAALARMLGPTVGSLSVAWSLANGLPPPLDFHFVFTVVLPLLALVPYFLAGTLPAGIDPKYTERCGTSATELSQDNADGDRSNFEDLPTSSKKGIHKLKVSPRPRKMTEHRNNNEEETAPYPARRAVGQTQDMVFSL